MHTVNISECHPKTPGSEVYSFKNPSYFSSPHFSLILKQYQITDHKHKQARFFLMGTAMFLDYDCPSYPSASY